MKKGTCARVAAVMCFVLTTLCCAACGSQDLSFGEERFYGVKTAEELGFVHEREYPIQTAIGESRVWTLTAGSMGSVYEREFETENLRSLGGRQEKSELVMGISAVGDQLYACVACSETVQMRKLFGDGQWETMLFIPWEEAPEQIQPAVVMSPGESGSPAGIECGNRICLLRAWDLTAEP